MPIERKPYCLYTDQDVKLWKTQAPHIQDAWGKFCHEEAEAWDKDAIMGDHNTATAYQWAPCSFSSWLMMHFPAAVPKPPNRTLPDEMTPEIEHILGMPNFQCGPVAEILRLGGQAIERRAEKEQAAVLWWCLGLTLEHGAKWHDMVGDRLEKIVKKAKEAK